MTIHSHSTWQWGDPITDELIDEIIYIVEANGRVFAFGICSNVDQFAYAIMEKCNVDETIENSPKEIQDQMREIFTRVNKKMSERRAT